MARTGNKCHHACNLSRDRPRSVAPAGVIAMEGFPALQELLVPKLRENQTLKLLGHQALGSLGLQQCLAPREYLPLGGHLVLARYLPLEELDLGNEPPAWCPCHLGQRVYLKGWGRLALAHRKSGHIQPSNLDAYGVALLAINSSSVLVDSSEWDVKTGRPETLGIIVTTIVAKNPH